MKWDYKTADSSWVDARPIPYDGGFFIAAAVACAGDLLSDYMGCSNGEAVTVDIRCHDEGTAQARRARLTLGWSIEWLGDVPAADEVTP